MKLLRALRRWNAARAVPAANPPSDGNGGTLRSKYMPPYGSKEVAGAVADSEKIIWVPPASIRFKLRSAPIIAFRSSNVQYGEWDLNRRKIEETAKFHSVMQHFRDGLDWEDTEIFRRYAVRLGRGEVIRGCRTIAELKVVYRTDMNVLYQSLNRNGFLLHQARKKKRNDLPHVYVARDGEIIFGSEGNHRLAMARLLEFDEIGCRVMGRHADWQALRERLFESDIGSRRRLLGHVLAKHPDLQDLLGQGAAIRGDQT